MNEQAIKEAFAKFTADLVDAGNEIGAIAQALFEHSQEVGMEVAQTGTIDTSAKTPDDAASAPAPQTEPSVAVADTTSESLNGAAPASV